MALKILEKNILAVSIAVYLFFMLLTLLYSRTWWVLLLFSFLPIIVFLRTQSEFFDCIVESVGDQIAVDFIDSYPFFYLCKVKLDDGLVLDVVTDEADKFRLHIGQRIKIRMVEFGMTSHSLELKDLAVKRVYFISTAAPNTAYRKV